MVSFALEFHVIGNRSGKIVVGVLTALPVGDVRLHAQQRALQLAGGFVCRHRQNVDGQHQVAVKVAEFGHKAVLDVAGVVLQVQHPAIPCVQLEMVGGKLHAVGAEPILEMLPAPGVFVDIELRRSLFPGLKKSRKMCRRSVSVSSVATEESCARCVTKSVPTREK